MKPEVVQKYEVAKYEAGGAAVAVDEAMKAFRYSTQRTYCIGGEKRLRWCYRRWFCLEVRLGTEPGMTSTKSLWDGRGQEESTHPGRNSNGWAVCGEGKGGGGRKMLFQEVAGSLMSEEAHRPEEAVTRETGSSGDERNRKMRRRGRPEEGRRKSRRSFTNWCVCVHCVQCTRGVCV